MRHASTVCVAWRAVLMLGLLYVSLALEFGPYNDGSILKVVLAGGAGDAARITVVPPGANQSFLRYQGFINKTSLLPSSSFAVATNTSKYVVLTRPGWSLNVSLSQPIVSLSVGGVVVSADLEAPTRLQGSASTQCDPPGWKGLAPGIATTVASSGACLRGVRSLSPEASSDTGVDQEHIYGFGQTVTPGLSAIGTTKFIATFSTTLDTGPSHVPSPSYISLARNVMTNSSVSHGFFLNTHGFSAFDVGRANKAQLVVSSPDPVYDYFLFTGPTPGAVVAQMSELIGGKLSLPPKWAMGMKYDPAEKGYNTSFIQTVIQQFADRDVRPDRVVLEPAWQGAQYNWDTTKFPDVPGLIANVTPTKLVLWEHPLLDQHSQFYESLRAADCIAHAPAASNGPVASQFSDLTLGRCQQLWKEYQLAHAIQSGAVGFKLDEDDVDVNVGFNDSTVFPSGFKGHQFHNIQGYIWQRLYHEMFESIGKRTWLQSRGGYAGSQAYPTSSYSDGYDYKTYVLGVVNSGFSGLMWAPEMRHATCGPNHSDRDHADFARRTQLMFLSSQAQYNAWDSADGTTLWPDGGPGAANCSKEWMDMFRTHFQLREGLAAYIYSAFETQSRTGIPITRALVLDSPEDLNTWAIDDQYLFGDTLMFAPAGINDPQSTLRNVYFPKTAPSWHPWFGASNATAYAPGSSIPVPTPIMTAPLFVKGGKPIFYQERDTASAKNELGIRVWVPATQRRCSNRTLDWSGVYDDDGETTVYKTSGAHWRGAAGFASCADGRHLLQFEVSSLSYATQFKRLKWSLRGIRARPSRVECAGAGTMVDHEWSHIPKHNVLHILVTNTNNHSCAVFV